MSAPDTGSLTSRSETRFTSAGRAAVAIRECVANADSIREHQPGVAGDLA